MQDVLKLWRAASSGILSTTSVEVEGYPFGSVVPYVTLDSGAPVIYISTISQHYQNLSADARACLTVIEAVADDPQAGARISLLADAAPVSPGAVDAVSEAYFESFPASRQFAGTHGFQFWVLQPKRIRFIGGFGKIYWIEAEDWAAAAK